MIRPDLNGVVDSEGIKAGHVIETGFGIIGAPLVLRRLGALSE